MSRSAAGCDAISSSAAPAAVTVIGFLSHRRIVAASRPRQNGEAVVCRAIRDHGWSYDFP